MISRGKIGEGSKISATKVSYSLSLDWKSQTDGTLEILFLFSGKKIKCVFVEIVNYREQTANSLKSLDDRF